MAENVIKNEENTILSTEVAQDLKSVPSIYPCILSHTLSRYDFKHVFVPLAAGKCAEVFNHQPVSLSEEGGRSRSSSRATSKDGYSGR